MDLLLLSPRLTTSLLKPDDRRQTGWAELRSFAGVLEWKKHLQLVP